ncbi:hypothetical protein [Amycolatopsis nalaikhensis]|uniref:Uncharacterized protein n=1 Tax=Amycolatopsis nalaikhensis TaxID=715472 RepID=A0ABY8XP37_9PSEU|nr:hypothetical protein [Amycolatopsis sp. 2-2]WIV57435.1 hypothetical protein QP939_01710 [Amycolatopsis sp. 2-2]
MSMEPSPVLSARARAERIKLSLSTAYEELAQAFAEEDWRTLGYASWDEYREQEFGDVLTKIRDVHTRTAVHRALSDAGMSQRQIARSTGSSQSTVSRDLHDDGDDSCESLPEGIADEVRHYEETTRERTFIIEMQQVRSSAHSVRVSLGRAIEAMNDEGIPVITTEYLNEAITALEDVTAVLERLRVMREVMA